MASTTKPAIVIVPGSWHVPAHYSLLHKALVEADYSVTTCEIPSVGAAEPHLDINNDVAAIQREIITYLDQDLDVVVVMHSFGGLLGSCASQGLLPADRANGKGIIQLVYLCAGVMPLGLSLYQASGGLRAPYIKVLGEAGTGVFMSPDNPSYDPRELFCNDCSPAVQEDAVGKLKLSSESTLYSPATFEAWKDVESNSDLRVGPGVSRGLAGYGGELRGWQVETG